ncbi:hypothetical protein Hypma_016404 [Hypsizygus marmoreus]|uniref:Uncharacterized protein n=1 Tax=Hypsizygus marmoreus TaxID=39966 RepID=A0A369IZY8_HYPMA|nr:hypothetical protein Hypma_016404 [Hypsizygus marmoreus]
MSNSLSPFTDNGYASPVVAHSPAPSSKSSSTRSTPKPPNVFTNDGSFLERFQRTKKEEEEKRQEQEALEKKKHFDTRFKNRGKRPPPDPTPSSDITSCSSSDEHPSKKVKSDQQPITEYEKQVKTYTGGASMKDTGTGIRPLVK